MFDNSNIESVLLLVEVVAVATGKSSTSETQENRTCLLNLKRVIIIITTIRAVVLEYCTRCPSTRTCTLMSKYSDSSKN